MNGVDDFDVDEEECYEDEEEDLDTINNGEKEDDMEMGETGVRGLMAGLPGRALLEMLAMYS